jgi:hypothetical protein
MATEKAPTATPSESTQPAKKPGVGRFVTPILALVAALAVGGISGVAIGQSTATASTQLPAGFDQGQRTDGAGAGLGDLTMGTIASIDGDTITVTLSDGTTTTITTSADTAVTTTTDGSVSDIVAGDTVTVAGATGADGAVAATSISEGTTGFGGGTPPTQNSTN